MSNNDEPVRNPAVHGGRIKFSIIIPTYNHLESDLQPCIESIVKTTNISGGDLEIIVVANGCSDGTEQYVKSLVPAFPAFKLLSFPHPMGYTRAMNTGICASSGEFVVPFNNDNVLLDWGTDVWLSLLSAPFANPKVGLSGPFRQFRNFKPFVVFCCCMIRRSLFWEIGMLDEAFNPGAGEDTDFCMKALERGYLVVQVPQEKTDTLPSGPFPLWHKGGRTVSEDPEWKNVVARNEKLLQKRWGIGN